MVSDKRTTDPLKRTVRNHFHYKSSHGCFAFSDGIDLAIKLNNNREA